MPDEVIKAIEEQQKSLDQYSPAWCVGEQLKDILRETPAAAELVLQDLANAGMALTDCEKKSRNSQTSTSTGIVGAARRTKPRKSSGNSMGLASFPQSNPHRRFLAWKICCEEENVVENVDELMAMIPEPPADLVDWLKKKGCFQKNLLVIKCGWMGEPGSKVKSLDLVCTACGEHFQVARDEPEPAGCSHGYPMNPWASEYHATENGSIIADGREIVCPKCGATVMGIHIGHIDRYEEIIEARWPLVIARHGKNIVIAGYRVSKKVNK